MLKRTQNELFGLPLQVTSVTFNDAGDHVVSSGIDNSVKIWDLRKTAAPAHVMDGHTDTVTRW